MNKSALVTYVKEQLAINSLATDAELLALAQAVPDTVTHDLASCGRMMGLLGLIPHTSYGNAWLAVQYYSSVDYVISDYTDQVQVGLKTLCGLIYEAIKTSSPFNFRENDATGTANRTSLDTLITLGVLPATAVAAIGNVTPKDAILKLAEKVTVSPYVDVTLTDIAEARITGTTAQNSVTYPANLNYFVRLPTQNIKVFITRVDTTYAQTIKIYKSEAPKDADKTLDASYLRNDTPIASVSLAVGQVGKPVEISKDTSVHLQLDGESDKSIPFDMTVEIV